MKTDEFIRTLIAALPGRTVEGKKRLQKLAYFLHEAGLDGHATFSLKNFGPYSAEIDNSTALLTILGGLEETSRTVGASGYLTTVFSIPAADFDIHPLATHLQERLDKLCKYSTIELEVASTVHFFKKAGHTAEKAVELTKIMKPTKTSERVLQKVPEILQVV